MSLQYSEKIVNYPSNNSATNGTTNTTISKTPFLIEDILYISNSNNNNCNQNINKNIVSEKISNKSSVNNVKTSPHDNEDIKKPFSIDR